MKNLISYFFFATNSIILFFILTPPSIDVSIYEPKILSQEYDFIIVGAGSAGCVVASRLVEANFSVLLIEEGGSDLLSPIIDLKRLSFVFTILEQTPNLFNYFGNYAFFDNFEKRYVPRGRFLGGTGAINAQIWNQGSSKIFDHWEKSGNEGWSYEQIKKYFDIAEEKMKINNKNNYNHKSMDVVLEVAQNLYGKFENFQEKEEGFGYFNNSMKNGFRQTTCDAYLKPLLGKMNNLHLKLNAHISKVLIKENYAFGVEYINRDDLSLKNPPKYIVKAKNEVILSAGTFNSPTILMHSGIGNKTELEKLGIKSLHNLPGVGQNYQDHFAVPIGCISKREDWTSVYMETTLRNMYDAYFNGKGPFTNSFLEIQGYFKSNHSKYKDIADYQIMFGAVSASNRPEDLPKNYSEIGFVSSIFVLGTPKHSGSLHLKSNKSNDHPIIEGVFMKDEESLKAAYETYNHIQQIYNDEKIKDYVHQLYPNESSIKDINLFKNYLQEMFYIIYHPVGTCKMGDIKKDKYSVVDNKLNVHGIKKLKIIDGSIMPDITNANTNAPIVMIAEKGVDLIIKQYQK